MASSVLSTNTTTLNHTLITHLFRNRAHAPVPWTLTGLKLLQTAAATRVVLCRGSRRSQGCRVMRAVWGRCRRCVRSAAAFLVIGSFSSPSRAISTNVPTGTGLVSDGLVQIKKHDLAAFFGTPSRCIAFALALSISISLFPPPSKPQR